MLLMIYSWNVTKNTITKSDHFRYIYNILAFKESKSQYKHDINFTVFKFYCMYRSEYKQLQIKERRQET